MDAAPDAAGLCACARAAQRARDARQRRRGTHGPRPGRRIAELRWGPDADDDLRLKYDADVATALALFPRLEAMLAAR